MARLLQLRIENFQRIVAATIDFTPQGITEICGRNGQGKSSAINAIWTAIGGAKASPKQPIRSGSNRSQISLKLDELEVVREFDSRGTRLHVYNANGDKINRPQEALDRLFAKLGFDPFDFMRLKSTEQAAILRQITGLDFTALDRQRAKLYEERTDVNRAIKQQEAGLANLPEVPPTEEVSAVELQARLQAANKENEEVAKAKRNVEQKSDEIGRCDREITEKEKKIAELQSELAQLIECRDEAKEELYQLQGFVGDEVDTTAIAEQIGKIEETNRRARAFKERAAALEALRANRAHAEDLTDRMEEIDAERGRILAAAPFPVPGLSLDEANDAVTFNGLPLTQESTAKKIQICLAITAALNPELRLLVVKEGSLLDNTSLATLAQWAEDNAYQVIVEMVTEEVRGHGVVIEEGRVKELEQELAV